MTALLFVLLGFSSCMTQKPNHMGLKDYNKNNVKIVQSPHYKKKLTLVGKGTQAGAAAGGILGAMTIKPTIAYDGSNEKTTNGTANVIIGASVGYGITSLYYTLKGQGKKTFIHSESEFQTWLAKYNKQKIGAEYVYTGFTADYGYLVLPNNYITEQNYVVNSVQDAIMFKNAFPYSKRMSEVEYQAYISIKSYDEAILFINSFPKSVYAINLKKRIEDAKAACARNKTDPSSISVDKLILGGAALCMFIKDEYPNLCKVVSCLAQYRIAKADEKSIFNNPIVAAAAIEFVVIPYVEKKKNNEKAEFDTFYGKLKKFSTEQTASAFKDLAQEKVLKELRSELDEKGYTKVSKALSDNNVSDFKAFFSLITCIISD